jgi:hypothetical protein
MILTNPGTYDGIHEVGLKRINRRTWRWLVQDPRAGIGCRKYVSAILIPYRNGDFELTVQTLAQTWATTDLVSIIHSKALGEILTCTDCQCWFT